MSKIIEEMLWEYKTMALRLLKSRKLSNGKFTLVFWI